MAHENETLPAADEGPVQRTVRPRAWAIFVDNGNARMWSTFQPHVQKLADAEGLEVTRLYDQAAIDAAVAAERERCAKLCEGMHDEDRPGDYAWTIRTEWADGSQGPNVEAKAPVEGAARNGSPRTTG